MFIAESPLAFRSGEAQRHWSRPSGAQQSQVEAFRSYKHSAPPELKTRPKIKFTTE
jgi:hypothetical protein